MHIFILCGGEGKRLNDYSLPKPLNMINGRPSIYYTLEKMPEYIKNINFIVGQHLIKYNFENIIKSLFIERFNYNFYYLPYFTRGAVESGLLGLNNINIDGHILFMDNDNIYTFPEDFTDIIDKNKKAFIGYSIDKSEINKYSYIKISNENNIIEIKEKNKISDNYCCGIYGFENINQFRKYGIKIMNENINNEKYLSLIYDYMIKDNIEIKAILFPLNNKHIGTYEEIISYKCDIKNKICFDMDDILNNKISKNIINKLKKDGHYIILNSILKSNIDLTLNTILNDIEYDIIIYGKIDADIYIDTKSINPNYNKLEKMGLFNYDNEIVEPLNKLKNNIFNEIILENNYIIKTGLKDTLEGENYFYNNIPNDLINYFPKYIKYDNNINKLYIENIKGIPFYTLYKCKMLTLENINILFNIINKLHTYNYEIEITIEDIYNNYIIKLKDRFLEKHNYPFDDAEEIQTKCIDDLEYYIKTYKNNNITGIIHGDLWFSNILLDYNNNIKLIDMKGKLYNKLTLNGDIYYDYGKLYQSILGYDSILYDDIIDNEYYQYIKTYFEDYIIKQGLDINRLKIITFSLVIGTFKYIDINSKKRIWDWIKRTFIID